MTAAGEVLQLGSALCLDTPFLWGRTLSLSLAFLLLLRGLFCSLLSGSCLPPSSVLLHQDDLDVPQGTLVTPGGRAPGLRWGEARDAVKHPALPRATAYSKALSGPDVNWTEVKKPYCGQWIPYLANEDQESQPLHRCFSQHLGNGHAAHRFRSSASSFSMPLAVISIQAQAQTSIATIHRLLWARCGSLHLFLLPLLLLQHHDPPSHQQ